VKPIELTTRSAEEHEHQEHRQGRDQRGRHQAGDSRLGLPGGLLEHAERDGQRRTLGSLAIISGQK